MLNVEAVETMGLQSKGFKKEVTNGNWPLSNLQRILEGYNATCITDSNGKIKYVNEGFCSLSKYAPSELYEQSINKVVCDKHHSTQFFEDLWDRVSSGEVWKGLLKNRAKNGANYWAQTSIRPLKDEQGSTNAYLVVKTDVTKEMELTDRNSQLTRLLEEEREKVIKKKHALDGVIEHIDEEKLKILREIKVNLESSIFPLLAEAMEKFPKEEKYLQIVEQNLRNISKPIFDRARDWKSKLTAKEIQICSLIKQGLVIKEIAPIMHLSPRTIEKHRENIRKKLGLKERKMNLSAHLLEQG